MTPAPNYEVFKDDAGLWRWRLQAKNGEIIAQSESYTNKWAAERGVEDAQRASAEASEGGD